MELPTTSRKIKHGNVYSALKREMSQCGNGIQKFTPVYKHFLDILFYNLRSKEVIFMVDCTMELTG